MTDKELVKLQGKNSAMRKVQKKKTKLEKHVEKSNRMYSETKHENVAEVE